MNGGVLSSGAFSSFFCPAAHYAPSGAIDYSRDRIVDVRAIAAQAAPGS